MRQRKVKNEEEQLSRYPLYLVGQPIEKKGGWNQLFDNENEIFVEFGCGRGKFIMSLASQNPDKNYIGIEGSGSVILRALEKARQANLPNILFVKEYVKDPYDLFDNDEVAGVYLNFSDPWPKDRHAKRRLLHSRYLSGYRKILKQGATIAFKTDNKDLFHFAINEFNENHMRILECTEDLHATDLSAKEITTEYEDKFRQAGKTVNYCKVEI